MVENELQILIKEIFSRIKEKYGYTDEQALVYLKGYEDCAEEHQAAADVKPVKQGHWIEKAEEYYRLWLDSGRSWDDMPYFVTGLNFACPHCFKQYDVNAEGVEDWEFCPKCGADTREKE